MTNEELLKLNTSILLIGFKIDALIKSMPDGQKEIYKNVIADIPFPYTLKSSNQS